MFVGPRTPFGRDLVQFDYSYDSGDDWEEEPIEDAEEIMSEAGSDGTGADDFEADDWLVGDDDEIEVEDDGIEAVRSRSRSLSPVAFLSAGATKKRKAEGATGAAAKKRRALVGPLVPFSRGPCFEDRIGECEYEPFNTFRIQLLNG